MNRKKTAAIVVLFNPTKEVIDNFTSYINDVDVIYCVDNSNTESNIYRNREKVIYLPQNANLGLAKALNIGCQEAIKDGAEILITFDQDTVCDNLTIQNLKKSLNNSKAKVVVPNIKYIYRNSHTGERIFSNETIMSNENENILWAITSGTMMSSDVYKMLNGFDENLFISQIDQDFSFRLKNNKIIIEKLGQTYIYQELGQTIRKNIFNKTLHIPNLSAHRYYYIFRNERYLRKKWGKTYCDYQVKLYKYIISILFFEKKKKEKICFCIKGFYDGKKING